MTYSERCFEEFDEEGYPLWLLNFGYKEIQKFFETREICCTLLFLKLFLFPDSHLEASSKLLANKLVWIPFKKLQVNR